MEIKRGRLRRAAAVMLLAAPLAFSLGAAAHAQELTQKPASAQIGLGFLLSSSGRDATNSTGLHLGAGFALPSRSLISPEHGRPAIDVDYNYNSGKGGRVEAAGVTYTERVPFSTGTEAGGAVPYGGLGVGVYYGNVKTSTTAPAEDGGTPVPDVVRPHQTTTTTTSSGNKTQIGGKILLGVEFRGGYFAEAGYIISGPVKGVRTDSLNLSAGMHF